MGTIKKDRNVALFLACGVLVVVLVAAALYRLEIRTWYLLWKHFEKAGLSSQGYQQYRDRRAGTVSVQLPDGTFARQGTTTVLGTRTWDLETGEQGGNSRSHDFWWEQVTKTERYLVPRNGARLALVTSHHFEDIDRQFVQALEMSTEKISGSDNGSVLKEGAVFGVKTAEGNLAKVKVVGFKDSHDSSFKEAVKLSVRWKSSARGKAKTVTYHIEMQWMLFLPVDWLQAATQ